MRTQPYLERSDTPHGEKGEITQNFGLKRKLIVKALLYFKEVNMI
jgi:hypothetical protein